MPPVQLANAMNHENNENRQLDQELARMSKELYPRLEDNIIDHVIALLNEQYGADIPVAAKLNLIVDYITENHPASDYEEDEEEEEEEYENLADFDDGLSFNDNNNNNQLVLELFKEHEPQLDKLIESNLADGSGASNGDLLVSNAERKETSKKLEDMSQLKESIKQDLKRVLTVIQDCDPNFIIALLRKHCQEPKRVNQVIDELLEMKSYPRLQDYMAIEKKRVELENHINMKLDIEDFLKIYKDPDQYFSRDIQRKVSKNYIDHCKIYLKKVFRYFKEDTIVSVLASNLNHLTPAYKQLSGVYQESYVIQRILSFQESNPRRKQNGQFQTSKSD